MAPKRARRAGPTYVIEHMEEGLEEWCRLEYIHMCEFLPTDRLLFLRLPEADAAALVPAGSAPPHCKAEGLEQLRAAASAAAASGDAAAASSASAGGAPEDTTALPPWDRICLLDMDAPEPLRPEEQSAFDWVVFGGILGNVHENEDGTYGSDDRTAELRRLGFGQRRHLGPMQMTTDTAVLVSKKVLEDGLDLSEIPWIDEPEIGEGTAAADAGGDDEAGMTDCVCMQGFRYVGRRGADGSWEPTLPKGMRELLVKDADADILGSL